MQLIIAADEQIDLDAAGMFTEAGAVLKSPAELADIVAAFASSDGWMDGVRLCAERRWYERLYQGPDYDIWAISWMPGQATGFHDHGASSGAFVVATGVLEEHRPDGRALTVYAGEPHAFDSNYAHDVRNVSLAPAVSIHAYSPPLSEMNEYELDGVQLVARQRTSARPEAEEEEWQVQEQEPEPEMGNAALSIDQLLAAARARLTRLSPEQANDAVAEADAILVDIRPEGQRAFEGSIPGAIIVERNVLEWRFDPASSARLPIVNDHDLQVILFCSEGYASSLAAAALKDLGLWRATDIIGGIAAWRAAGLPLAPRSDDAYD